MSEQLAFTLVRRSDPPTSGNAAARVNAGALERLVAAAEHLRSRGEHLAASIIDPTNPSSPFFAPDAPQQGRRQAAIARERAEPVARARLLLSRFADEPLGVSRSDLADALADIVAAPIAPDAPTRQPTQTCVQRGYEIGDLCGDVVDCVKRGCAKARNPEKQGEGDTGGK